MSDPKSFLAAVGRMAEAVNTPSLEARLFDMARMISWGTYPAGWEGPAHDTLLDTRTALSDLEAAKNDALTLANLREAEIELIKEALKPFLAEAEAWLRWKNEHNVDEEYIGRAYGESGRVPVLALLRLHEALTQPPEPTDAR